MIQESAFPANLNDEPAMRMPPVQFTVRLMMIVVLVVALACGWVVRQRRRQAPARLARAQVDVTSRFHLEPVRVPGRGGGSSRFRFLNGKPDQLRWVWTYKAWNHSENARVIDVEVSGGFEGSDLGPIVIKDRGGTRNARADRSDDPHLRWAGVAVQHHVSGGHEL